MIMKRAYLYRTLIVLFMFGCIFNSSFTKIDNGRDISNNGLRELPSEQPLDSQSSYKMYDYNHLGGKYPFDQFIFAPTYVERYQNQVENQIHFYLPYDENYRECRGTFEWYRIFVDGQQKDYQEIYNTWEFTVDYSLQNTVMNNIGIHNVTFEIFHSITQQIYAHEMIVNITEDNPVLGMYYDDFYYYPDNYQPFSWTVYTTDNLKFNYTVIVDNNSISDGYDEYSGTNVNLNLETIFAINDKVGSTSKIELFVIDENGKSTYDCFNLTKAGNYIPQIVNMATKTSQYGDFVMYETQNAMIVTSAIDSDSSPLYDDLDKIYIIIFGDYGQPYPYRIIENVSSNQIYEVPLTTIRLSELEAQYSTRFTNLRFMAIAVDNSGRSSYYSMEINLGGYLRQEFLKTENIHSGNAKSGKYISSLDPSFEYNSDVKFKLTISTTLTTSTNMFFAASTASEWERNLQEGYYRMDMYSRSEYNGVFGNVEIDNTYYEGGGVVFWINAANKSAVTFPITLRLTYPDEISPNLLFGEPPLQFMHWKSDYEDTAEFNTWHVYSNESYVDNYGNTINEQYKLAGENIYEFKLYDLGLYGFGIDAFLVDEWSNSVNDAVIPGYSLFPLITIFGLAIVFLISRNKHFNH
ncbi:hypothetical protein NEF87_001812 [Candidatus Lokiarchaeum ossiferum]|uniref:Uncharacterized protein n=1 Tax=Candidatus Lokiarchaeum ossiferum TaxID=2951803 RepID=A0ABY6HPV2_9ARCH|nr:hypothetical protein NEF87_001812 [Candidatus Lokiarchaeum sp. B-35]